MNKLPWFTHDNDAHEDIWIQKAMDKFGHFGYAAYFLLIELLDRHGTGDKLRIPRWKLAQKLRSRWPQVRLYLDFCRSSSKVDYRLIGPEVELQIKKFRERQSKMKSKLLSTFREPSSNLQQEEEEEREYTPLPPKQGELQNGIDKTTGLEATTEQPEIASFGRFWEVYPKKQGKAVAFKAFVKISPAPPLLASMLAALELQKQTPQWTQDNGKYIPLPATWLNGRRWEDEIQSEEIKQNDPRFT